MISFTTLPSNFLESKEDLLIDALSTWSNNPGKALLRALEMRLFREMGLNHPILDFGSGDGLTAKLLKTRIEVGLDLSLKRCQIASNNKTYFSVINGHGEFLPFRDRSFKTVISNSVLEHIDNIELVIRELHRVLDVGGSLAFTVPIKQKLDSLFYSSEQGLSSTELRQAYREYFNLYWGHKRYLDPEEWRDLLNSAGFRSVNFKLYEPVDTAKVIDLLNSIEFEYKEWVQFPKRSNFVEQIWIKLLHSWLYKYFVLENELQLCASVFVISTK